MPPIDQPTIITEREDITDFREKPKVKARSAVITDFLETRKITSPIIAFFGETVSLFGSTVAFFESAVLPVKSKIGAVLDFWESSPVMAKVLSGFSETVSITCGMLKRARKVRDFEETSHVIGEIISEFAEATSVTAKALKKVKRTRDFEETFRVVGETMSEFTETISVIAKTLRKTKRIITFLETACGIKGSVLTRIWDSFAETIAVKSPPSRIGFEETRAVKCEMKMRVTFSESTSVSGSVMFRERTKVIAETQSWEEKALSELEEDVE